MAKAPPDGPPRGKTATKAPKPAAKTGKAPEKTLAKAPAARKIEIAFPKKAQPPTAAAFAARLPLALGKRFDGIRTFLLKQEDVAEDVFFYGPKSGWALRYLVDGRPLCSLHLHGDTPLGIVSLDPGAIGTVDWKGLSPVAQKARRAAHGSPSLLWLDVPLDGDGAQDFKALLRAKLAARG